MSHFHSYITSLAYTGRTPCITSELYQNSIPQALQDAISVSALYLTKSGKNESIVLNILGEKVNRLLQSFEKQACLTDHLASVQALLMYQVIRFFDGDIRQRALAERQMTCLETWASALLQRLQEAASFTGVRTPWHNWLLCESIRRTVLTSTLLHALYNCIKEGYCEPVQRLSRLPVTQNMDLWDMGEGQWLEAFLMDEVAGLQTYRDFAKGWFPRDNKLLAQDSFEACLLAACSEEYLQLIQR